jgi:ActD protein
MTAARLYGLMAEFEDPTALVDAARAAREAGFTQLDAYSPFPIEALTEALDLHDRKLPAVVLGGGILGGLAGYALCYWASVIEYPLNVGGKPFHSAPAFIVPTFETTILFAAFAAVLGMLALNGLPMPYHPVFNAPRFALASRDRFFLCIEARDPKFDHDETWAFLTKLGPSVVMDVEE